MANLNKVMLIGRLTRDPELRHTGGGTAVTEIGVAINREWTTSEGDRKKDTTFVDVVCWAKTAENVHKYLGKGSEVFVEGRLELDQWETQGGEKRQKLRVVADWVQFLGKKKDGDGDRGSQGGGSGRPPV